MQNKVLSRTGAGKKTSKPLSVWHTMAHLLDGNMKPNLPQPI